MVEDIKKNINETMCQFIVDESIKDPQYTRYDFEHKLMADDYYMEIVHDRVTDKYKVEARFIGKIVFPDKNTLEAYKSWASDSNSISYEEEYGYHWLETDWIDIKELGNKVLNMIRVANDFSLYCVW